jgi:hypothetical protein
VGSSFQALVDTNAMAESDFDLDAWLWEYGFLKF